MALTALRRSTKPVRMASDSALFEKLAAIIVSQYQAPKCETLRAAAPPSQQGGTPP